MKNLNLNPRLFALLALSFVLATIAGTVSHEIAHYFTMQKLGEGAILRYDRVQYYRMYDKESQAFDSLYKADSVKINANAASPEKQYFLKYRQQLGEKNARHDFIANLAGPMQTMITGTAGFLLLYFRRKKITAYGMKAIDWLGVFLAFFWSRQLLNFLGITYSYITRCTGCISGGDEAKLSRYLNLPWPTINSITGTLAALILLWVVFYIIPKQQRFTFIIAGLAGSALGWLVWMEWMGPVLLP
jgi:hypothetical protein